MGRISFSLGAAMFGGSLRCVLLSLLGGLVGRIRILGRPLTGGVGAGRILINLLRGCAGIALHLCDALSQLLAVRDFLLGSQRGLMCSLGLLGGAGRGSLSDGGFRECRLGGGLGCRCVMLGGDDGVVQALGIGERPGTGLVGSLRLGHRAGGRLVSAVDLATDGRDGVVRRLRVSESAGRSLMGGLRLSERPDAGIVCSGLVLLGLLGVAAGRGRRIVRGSRGRVGLLLGEVRVVGGLLRGGGGGEGIGNGIC